MTEIEELKEIFEKFSIFWLKHQTKLIDKIHYAGVEINKQREKIKVLEGQCSNLTGICFKIENELEGLKNGVLPR